MRTSSQFKRKRSIRRQRKTTKDDSWQQIKTAEKQKYANQRDIRRFYAFTKEIFGPIKSTVAGLKDSDDTTILTDPESILDLWKNTFSPFSMITPLRRKTSCETSPIPCPELDVTPLNLP